METRVARCICGLVAGLIETDGEFHPNEEDLLHRVMAKFGLSADAELVPTVDAVEATHALAELSEPLRHEALELLIDAAIIDGKVVPAEQTYLVQIASTLGVPEDQLMDRITDRLLEG